MNKDKNACVIGAGNIGTHHAKSLLNEGFNLTVVDPIKPNIENIKWSENLTDNIISNDKVFIISTTARHHFSFVKKIAEAKSQKVVIIEKPLFCNRSDYEEFELLSASSNNNYYCNLPLYNHAGLKKIIKTYDLGELKSYNASGNNWGLACNLLHDLSMIDCLASLNNFEIDKYEAKIIETSSSKRLDYLEVFGTIQFSINNIPVSLSCENREGFNKEIIINFNNGEINIDFFSKEMLVSLSNHKKIKLVFDHPMASETTSKTVIQLLNEANGLPKAEKYSEVSLYIYSGIMSNLNFIPDGNLDFPFS